MGKGDGEVREGVIGSGGAWSGGALDKRGESGHSLLVTRAGFLMTFAGFPGVFCGLAIPGLGVEFAVLRYAAHEEDSPADDAYLGSGNGNLAVGRPKGGFADVEGSEFEFGHAKGLVRRLIRRIEASKLLLIGFSSRKGLPLLFTDFGNRPFGRRGE